jgi:hypothetical protein
MDSPVQAGISLIGITGHAGSGKDTVKEFLIETYARHYTISFADPLKEAASAAFGIPLDWFYERHLKEEPHPNWDVSPRAIAQFMGTEMFRETLWKLLPQVESDFWIHRASLRLNNQYVPVDEGEFESGDTVVIPDVRFQNEYDWIIRNKGIIIHLTRAGADGTVGIPGHASETKLNMHCKERTYQCENNGTISELHRKIANLIVSLKY